MIPVVLCGGSGTRLWPLSREAFPKPFISLDNGPSLLQLAIQRGASLSNGPIFLVTNESYGFKTKEECASLEAVRGRPIVQILEPVGRNTGPAAALAALAARSRNEDPVLLFLPADHIISDEAAFEKAAIAAQAYAEMGEIALLGVMPANPESGFGYIKLGNAKGEDAYASDGFVEKPEKELARKLIDDGNVMWNSGIFCCKASTLLEAIANHAPSLFDAAAKTWDQGRKAANGPGIGDYRFERDVFAQQPDVSIDYAIMEHSKNLVVVKANFPWSDVGSWKSVSELMPSDANGNTSIGDCLMVETSGCHVQSDSRLIATVGLSDLVVVDTPDAVLIAKKDSEEAVKDVVSNLLASGHESARHHCLVNRPWGTYRVLHEGPRFKMKEIVVHPGETLSLQMHHHRSEHWIVISGTAKVTCGKEETMVYSNESTYIPVGSTHRLENPGKVDVILIEVQCGDYVGEDDIVRFDDRYGRVNEPVLSVER